MRKFVLSYCFCFVLLCMYSFTHAQVITKFGDNVSTVDGIIKAYYEVVSVKKGEMPSYERDSLLHAPNAMVGGVEINKEGKPVLQLTTLKKYHQLSDDFMQKNGFYENEISRKTETFGYITHVFSTYETRYTEGGEIIERGINSIELYFDGTRYWITSWIFDGERKDNPIPKQYLSN